MLDLFYTGRLGSFIRESILVVQPTKLADDDTMQTNAFVDKYDLLVVCSFNNKCLFHDSRSIK